MEYFGVIKKRDKYTQIALVSILLIIIMIELWTKKYTYLFLSFFVLLACFLDKKHIISKEGINIQYRLLGKEINTLWTWEEVTGLGIDRRKFYPNYALFVGKNMTTRLFQIKKEDYPKIKKLMEEKRPQVKIDTIN